MQNLTNNPAMTEKSFFLNDEEMYELTGTRMQQHQARWLNKQNPPFPFTLTLRGKPKVLRAYVEQRLGLAGVAVDRAHIEPDFSKWE